MNYAETLKWMFAQLPMYQQNGASAYRKDLTNTLLLTEYLGHPERQLRFIHVAGTNGKGSVSHMLASVLMEAGFKTGLFTSPHLKDYRERIKINGTEIPEMFVVSFMNQHKPFFEAHDLSFFEMTVGLAFAYFVSEACDIVVLETGMGGRLDSTNIVSPLLSVITNIAMDHTQFLGDTLEAIAAEKAGIIKSGVPVVISEYTDETKPVFLAKAEVCSAPIYFASETTFDDLPSDLLGDYQQHNKHAVVQAITLLQEKGWPVSNAQLRQGLMNTVKNTGLLGRWQQLGDRPKVICDTAHNSAGLAVTMKQVLASEYDKLHIVLGMVNDKNLNEILPLFPKNAIYYFCAPKIPRAMAAGDLYLAAHADGLNGSVYNSVSEAYTAALRKAGGSDFIYVGGSTFVVAEIL